MLNILHITTFLQGGAGRVLKDLAVSQKQSGNNVLVITTSTEVPGYYNYKEYFQCLDESSIQYFKFDSTFKRDIYLNLNVANEVRALVQSNDIDIIHAHASVPALVGIIGRSGVGRYVPVLQTMHGWGLNKKPEQEKMDVTVMNGIDQVVTVSESDKKLLVQKGVQENKIITIYNGIEKNKNCEIINDNVISEILDYKRRGYKIVGCIGSVCIRKNQQLLIEAVNRMSRGRKVFCAFIGEGHIISELQQKVYEYDLQDRIKFYGYMEDASHLIKYFDYFILPSKSEGFPVAITEAFREKVPVIASDIDAIKEIVKDNANGFLFSSNDESSLSIVLEKAMFDTEENHRECIINAAYNCYKEKFQLEKMIKSYENTYLNLIK